MRSSLIIIVLSFFILGACDEPFQLDQTQAPPRVVIEGMVTNQPGKQSVKVTRSADFYSSGPTPRITDAQVRVADDLGHVFNFIHNPNFNPDSLGVYVPEVPFRGEVGRTYTLTVETGGEIFEAQDKLVSVLPIDSLTYKVDEEQLEDDDNEGKVYELLLYAKEEQNVKNFFLFKFFANDTLQFDNETDIYFSDDELLAENLDGVPAPVYFRHGDKVRVEIYSMSREGYVYHSDLFTLLNNDSGMFSPIPASPRTNLSNDALGFFQVSAVTVGEIEIQ